MNFLASQSFRYVLQIGAIILGIVLAVFVLKYINEYYTAYKTRKILEKHQKPDKTEQTHETLENLLKPEEIEPEHHDEMTRKLMKVGLRKEQIEKLSHHIAKK